MYKSEFEAIHKSIDNIIQIQKDFQTLITESNFLLNKLKFANSPEEKLVILKEIQELCKKNKNLWISSPLFAIIHSPNKKYLPI